ncbi:protein-glutamine gamma-glutamyltransferase E-like [Podarcis raffonei]|uniref:protein-glutamine gamma-glutamyltransferase E-like n=1 Tax=Podarcis raffonei TaxID=65483 RepID=UPI0023293C6E|nr:protein-glutamine gamma-glutamyltransferase E-like [Podarcis raffonei]
MAGLVNTDWKLRENTIKHRTDEYPSKELVVRRGQAFLISLTSRGALPAADKLTFTVETGSTCALQAETRVAFGITSTPSRRSWSAVQTSAGYGSLSVSILSPVDAAIGRYQLSIKTDTSRSTLPSSLGTFVLLFNPWMPERLEIGEHWHDAALPGQREVLSQYLLVIHLSEDDVFMANEAERKEYVLSEFGVIFCNNGKTLLPWNYGQFEDGILDICLSMLDMGLKYHKDSTAGVSQLSDPIHIGRVLSAMINCNDGDRGVLFGCWKACRDGKDPGSWSGSVEILRQWESSGFEPVRYGQCWVFAGVLTTVLRCIGIPTRIISNFSSGCDKNENLILEPSESTWNFHVWNECWFARPDLGCMYNGWQVLDATPQGRSTTEKVECGPASVKAIKEGDVDLPYDTAFVFSEVNADIEGSLDTKSIGQNISTKAVDSNDRLDVTDNYKYKEGSVKEREVFAKACAKLNLKTNHSESARSLREAAKPSVLGKIKVKSPLEIGKDVHLVLRLTNLGSTTEYLTPNMAAWSINNTGKPIHEIWKASILVTLGPKEEKEFPINISYAKYKQYLLIDNLIKVAASWSKKEGGNVNRVIILEKPSVTIKVLGEAKVGKEVKVVVTIDNCFDEELKDGVLKAEGSGLLEKTFKKNVPPLNPQDSYQVQFKFFPRKSGTKYLLVNFSCNKFKDSVTYQDINVVD